MRSGSVMLTRGYHFSAIAVGSSRLEDRHFEGILEKRQPLRNPHHLEVRGKID
jgi:hypothetical protein